MQLKPPANKKKRMGHRNADSSYDSSDDDPSFKPADVEPTSSSDSSDDDHDDDKCRKTGTASHVVPSGSRVAVDEPQPQLTCEGTYD